MTKGNLLQLYRLNAYYAANPETTAAAGAKAVGFKSSSFNHYYNCVHLRDPKGVLAYSSMEGEIPPEDYAALSTRITHDTQQAMIAAFNDGGTIDQVAKRFNLHPQHVMVFSLVYRTYCGGTVNPGQRKWVPYSRQQYEAMAEKIEKYDQPQAGVLANGCHRLQKVQEYLQPELSQAIREMFLTKRGIPFAPPVQEPAPVEKKKRNGKPTLAEITEAAIEPENSTTTHANTEEILAILRRMEQQKVPAPRPQHFSAVESTFALDVMPPHNIPRWLSREAIALFPKLVKGEIDITRDEDAALVELDEFGLIEIPKTSSSDPMGGVTIHTNLLRVTDKGWALHRFIRDICEQTVYCALQDMGAVMGFNVSVGEYNGEGGYD